MGKSMYYHIHSRSKHKVWTSWSSSAHLQSCVSDHAHTCRDAEESSLRFIGHSSSFFFFFFFFHISHGAHRQKKYTQWPKQRWLQAGRSHLCLHNRDSSSLYLHLARFIITCHIFCLSCLHLPSSFLPPLSDPVAPGCYVHFLICSNLLLYF